MRSTHGRLHRRIDELLKVLEDPTTVRCKRKMCQKGLRLNILIPPASH